VHVYLNKHGVAIETALQKVEEVKRRKTREERLRMGLNFVIPGSAAFRDARVLSTVLSLFIFLLGLLTMLGRDGLVASPRPAVVSSAAGSVFWGAVALVGWGLG